MLQLKKRFQSAHEELKTKYNEVKKRLIQIEDDPKNNDPIYNLLLSIFNKNNAINIHKNSDGYNKILQLSRDRFDSGCPHRKPKDNTIGDAINWECILHVALKTKSDIVLVSHDGDFFNKFLVDEFEERVGNKITIYKKITDALPEFNVQISEANKKEEIKIIEEVQEISLPCLTRTNTHDVLKVLRKLSQDFIKIRNNFNRMYRDFHNKYPNDIDKFCFIAKVLVSGQQNKNEIIKNADE